MPMCRCGCVVFREIIFFPIRVNCYVGFSWVGIVMIFLLFHVLHTFMKIFLNSHLDDSTSNFGLYS